MKRSYRILSILVFFKIFSGNYLIQLIINGWVPKETGSIYTIPHRETVAGDATARSSTSNIIVIYGVNVNIYPEFKQSFLLSSNTVFIDSIQIASTGPSNNTQCLSLLVSFTVSLIMNAKIPSNHSCVYSLNEPYSYPRLMDLGFIIWVCTL